MAIPARRRPSERDSDAELNKFLQELRVMMPGVQVLFAFLLTLPFTQRFGDATSLQRAIYIVALLCAAASTAFIVAPSINHRLRWHEGAAEKVMATGNKLVVAGTVFLAVAIGASVFLIVDVVYGNVLAGALTAATIAVIAWLWWGMPLFHRARDGDGD